ncbi:hypothetical protein HNO88_003992 [Novosphingobium chloroacetimidivorans]|uniref:Uncharacterized protein n=1 Tax=Novosphingobium chloroacetimidivorans TaxID=1428314 RepID=A0A7W7NXG8_9SPHN|nr:hypothetical protein [Novosphingobium chloroacetimidivorans]MBB4860648.1 hypothetical protein [Novosphingobium chloroacetimidivorans]
MAYTELLEGVSDPATSCSAEWAMETAKVLSAMVVLAANLPDKIASTAGALLLPLKIRTHQSEWHVLIQSP